jgi:uncharacterized repeat protein (TIGR01451 family)
MRTAKILRRLLWLAVLVTAVVLSPFATSATAVDTPYKDIVSAGPLTDIYVGNDLSCQVGHSGDSSLAFFPPPFGSIPGDCGTFVSVGGTVYGPDFANHPGGTATSGSYTPFTPFTQSGVTGSGTSANPYQVVTVVDAGASGVRVTQSDTYIVGDESYRTQVTVTNTTPGPVSLVLYRAGDCYLAGSDFGYGFTSTFGTRNAVGCTLNQNNSPPGRMEEWVPLTGGNTFSEAFYNTIWNQISTGNALPSTCSCDTLMDNGVAISWTATLAAGGSAVFTQDTLFSPAGLEALALSKTADQAEIGPGDQNGYSITVTNSNAAAVSLSSISDELPAGFTYKANSTSGMTVGNPSITTSGGRQTLTWSGSFSVSAGGSLQLHFTATAPSAPGNYFNRAFGQATGGYTVLPTGDTAPVTVAPLTAVGVSGFSAVRSGRSVVLRWRTAGEVRAAGFALYRVQRGARLRVNQNLILAKAGGERPVPAYAVRDRLPRNVRVAKYLLEEVRLDGSRAFVASVSTS